MSNHVRKKFKTDRFRDRGKIVNNSSDNYSPYKVKSNDSKLNLNLSRSLFPSLLRVILKRRRKEKCFFLRGRGRKKIIYLS